MTKKSRRWNRRKFNGGKARAMRAYKTNPTEQRDYSERVLQLLCFISQSLRRIELQMGNIAPAQRPQTESNKIVAFNGGRRE